MDTVAKRKSHHWPFRESNPGHAARRLVCVLVKLLQFKEKLILSVNGSIKLL
jgi:hypothetical protein